MKVVQVGLSFSKYAQGAITEGIHKRLMSTGNESFVFFCDRNCPESKNAVIWETRIENIIKRGMRKFFGKKQFFAFIPTLRLIRKIKKVKPQLIHIHNIHDLTLDFHLFYRFLQSSNVKIVITLHDFWPITGGCYHYSFVGCTGMQRQCENCNRNKSQLDCENKETAKNFLIKKNCYTNSSTVFVSVSKWLYNEVKKTSFSKFKNVIITNGVNIDIFHPVKADFFNNIRTGHKRIVLGIANYWSESKGFSQFRKLAEMLGENYIIVLIGSYSSSMNNLYPQNLIMLGRLDEKLSLAKAYSSTDVFVHLSKEETFGLVIAEAACCGSPVLGYDATGISEVVKRAGGLLVPVDDLEGVRNGVERLCDIEWSERRKIAENARNEFSSNDMIDKYIELYKKEIEGI